MIVKISFIVPQDLLELIFHLMRRGKKRLNKERWEKCLIKVSTEEQIFCMCSDVINLLFNVIPRSL